MVATISPDPRLQFFANDGSFLVGGKLYTYAAGTTTPLATYTTSTGLIANTNPIILDSRGEASVWLGSSKYKFVLKTAADVDIWTQDQLQGYANADGSNATGTWPISITGNAGTATTATYATTAGSVTPGAAVTSITGAGLYGFTLPGGPITSSGTLTVTPPVPSTAGNVLTSNGSAWVSQAFAGGAQFRDQLFTASDTWTAPSGVTKVRAVVVAGGGGGFYNAAGPTSNFGGAGGVAAGTYTVVSGTTYTVTVGTAGVGVSTGTGGVGSTSSFGSFLSATGGGGATTSAPGTAGVGSSGTLTNSYPSPDIYTNYGGSIPYFKSVGAGIPENTGSSTAKVYSAIWSASNGSAGAGGGYGVAAPGYGGVGGIVYLEWVG